MEAPDLRVSVPRRWSEQLDGIAWLPRLIDKARAAAAGTLGFYLYGQSPMDTQLLRVMNQGYRSFSAIARSAPDDAGVLAALQRHDAAALERARLWSSQLHRRRLYMLVLDLDEGHLPRWLWLRPAANATTRVLVLAARRIWPTRAEATLPPDEKSPKS